MSSITVLSSLATREAYLELVPQFEHRAAQGDDHLGRNRRHQQADGRRRGVRPGDQLGAGIGELTNQGRIVAGTGTVLAKAGIGIGVRKGAPQARRRHAEAFKRALIAARTVGLSTGPSGVYLGNCSSGSASPMP